MSTDSSDLRYKLGIVGASGAMGRQIEAISKAFRADIVLRADRRRWTVREKPNVIVDVSRPQALPRVIEYCVSNEVALVEGTSALDEAAIQNLRKLGEKVPVIRASNFSFGHYLQRKALREVARSLSMAGITNEFAIAERHPTRKLDGPSSTAKSLAALWSTEVEGAEPRVDWTRMGLPVSDHEAWLTLCGEGLVIRHSVADYEAPALGALRMAVWLMDRSVGWWDAEEFYDDVVRGG